MYFYKRKSVDFSKLLVKEVFDQPFYLKNDKTNCKLEINNYKTAENIINELEVTHYKYDKSQESFIDIVSGIVLSNEITTGVEITEKMLKTGTFLYVYGRLEKLSDNVFIISKPFNTDAPFVITRQSRPALIDNMLSNVNALKVVFGIISAIGISVGIICVYRIFTKKNQNKKK